MIRDSHDFELVHEQLGRMERALHSTRQTVLPYNERRYRLLAGSYVEEILKLRAEIDQYLMIDAVAKDLSLNDASRDTDEEDALPLRGSPR